MVNNSLLVINTVLLVLVVTVGEFGIIMLATH